ncbi:MAG: hypothetical protein PHD04_03555 [Candidatus Pacebacteria bacterium]|jgi:hypothetical protein|nr:hypothetical protein [Candidatus Paceibacterota bacterium]
MFIISLSYIKALEEVETIITLDPLYRNGAAEYEITEFTPTMTVAELAFLRE